MRKQSEALLLVPLLPIFLAGLFPMLVLALLGFAGLGLLGILLICAGLTDALEAHNDFNRHVIVEGCARRVRPRDPRVESFIRRSVQRLSCEQPAQHCSSRACAACCIRDCSTKKTRLSRAMTPLHASLTNSSLAPFAKI